ncbi:branched-chain amino acid transport system substrate-binding protein [Roseomonas rosea]|uniref:Branched-chain amino acid transport system substrate-binding protein n=1 Tax=Muricoccus roseus TaxID=198092 RepID=A0A1M6PU52_9PROT|nr:ABC transporter substrate-binding protein [Roseomonas rosea]SHK11426.1 branched-chain amino acid transport system substrate-binding protein [Roseomonas rosea]
MTPIPRLPATGRRTALLGTLGGVAGFGLARPALAQSGQPIRIGMSMPLQVQLGRDARAALGFAVEEVNARGGLLGRKVEVAFADETDNTEAGVNGVRKLLNDDKVDALVGHYTSGTFLAAMPHIARAKRVTVIVGASSPAIADRVKQDYARYKYIFRTTMNASNQSADVLDFVSGMLVGELGLKRIGIVAENARWAQDIATLLVEGAAKVGAQVTVNETVDNSTTDFSPILSRVRSSGAQFMMTLLAHSKGDLLTKQWHDTRVPVLWGGIDGRAMDADYFNLVDGKCLSMIAANFAVRAPITPRTIPFFDSFKERTGHFPSYTAWTSANGFHVYAQAVERAKTLDADAVVAEMERTNYEGVEGRIEFDDRHDARSGPGLLNYVFAQWQPNGERVVLWPKAIRSGAMIVPPWLSDARTPG